MPPDMSSSPVASPPSASSGLRRAQPAPSGSSPTPTRFHSVRFYRPSPSAVHCLAVSLDSSLLAVSRADNSVEIWNLSSGLHATIFLERRIPGSSESSLEALCWGQARRLFAATTLGVVLELDIETLATKRQFAVTAGAAWCMGYNEKRNRLAVGTEEGYVCLVQPTDEGLEYDRVLDKQEGRILCLSWHSSGDFLATGSSDTVRVWDVSSGHPTARMTTGRTASSRETVVWSVAFADDMTVVSGDSRGKTCFWSAKTGTLNDAYQTHAADVLSICLSKDQDVAYASGVDPSIVQFQPVVRKDGRSKWVKSLHRQFHTHDVRSLAVAKLGAATPGEEKRREKSVILSAGVDASLAVHHPAAKTSVAHAAVSPHGGVGGECAALAADAGLLLLMYADYLEVWQLGKAAETGSPASETPASSGAVLPLSVESCKLLELRTKDCEALRCCCISSDGCYVAYSTSSRLRAYRLVINDGQEQKKEVRLKRLHVKSAASGSQVQPCRNVAFYQNGKGTELASSTEEGGLQFLAVDGDELRLVDELSNAKLTGLTGRGIAIMATTGKGQLAAVADYDGNVVTVDLPARQVISQLPRKSRAPLTCLSVTPEETAVAGYADQTLAEFGLRTGRHTKFSSQVLSRLPKHYRRRTFAARGLFKLGEGKLVVYDDNTICVVERDAAAKEDGQEKGGKRWKLNSNGQKREAGKLSEAKVTLLRKYEHLVFLDPLSDGSVAAVEVSKGSLEAQLPPSLRKKQYGTM